MAVCFNPKPTTYMPDRPPVLDPFLAVKNLGLKCLSRADSSVSPPPSGETWFFFLRDRKLNVVAFSLDDCCNYNPSPWKLYAVAFSLDDCCNYNPSVI
ncbi:Intermediate transcription factor 3 large subunit [Gossypium arboreum]|uniref:Intermediate transcription factor 3 large subunit n=1 Tax=Gossypium arboreum TaxID=29729 RepID=A0A0B0NUW0_GOSAR|nr:Intermediate transcription factor 3 large subunit [Gossypium arboreum]